MAATTEKRKKSGIAQQLEEKSQKYLAGGVLGKFKPPLDPLPVFVRAKGSRLIDARGKSYIDFLMGSGPLILGHAHPALVSAAERQLRKGTHYYWTSEPLVQLAEKIVQAAFCGGTVKFTNSGTEATFHALRMARAYTGREKILKFEGGYHGVHDYALMSSSPPTAGSYPEANPDSAGIPEGVRNSVLIAPFNDIKTTASILQEHGSSIAAVIVEPLQRIIKPRGTFLQDVRRLTTDLNIVYIFDEVVTGFRLDYGGAQQHYDVVPDVAVYGKALTGGFPLAAICGKKEVLETANPEKSGTAEYAFFSGTFNGNPLAAAAACACLDEIKKEGALKKLHDRGEKFMEQIRNLGRSYEVPIQVVGDGPVLQVFFTEKPVLDYPDTLNQDKSLVGKIGKMMVEKGIWVNLPGKIYLSLAHSEDDYQQFLKVFEDSLRALR